MTKYYLIQNTIDVFFRVSRTNLFCVIFAMCRVGVTYVIHLCWRWGDLQHVKITYNRVWQRNLW